MPTISRLAVPLAAALTVACGGSEFASEDPRDGAAEPADVAGAYSISVTNRENGCGFSDWVEGGVAQNIPLAIEQEGTDVQGTLGGLAGTLVALWLGSATFEGEVDESAIDMTIYGSVPTTSLGCTFTINAKAEGESRGDLLEGRILYVPQTNGSPDCGALEGCQTVQDFNGTRPPQ